MLKVYRNVMVVVCAVAMMGVLAGTASADFIYDFDSNVGQTLIPNQSLTNQDSWELRTGNTAWKDNIVVGTGATGNYALNSASDNSQSYMTRNSSFALQDGLDFEVSAVVSHSGTSTTMQTGLEHNYGFGRGNWIVSGVQGGGLFCWYVREGDGTNYTQLVSLTTSIPNTTAKMWKVGFEYTAMGGNRYAVLPYYQDVTDPNNMGAKVYQYDNGNPYDVTYSSPISGMFNQLYMRMASNVAGGNTMDDFQITQVPEPSTLALLGCGLIGLLAYAWRKRK